MALGDTPICLVPGCGKRAKDARIFCHEDWMKLPGAMRHKIGKLYTSSRRGHWNNPRQGQWRRVVTEAIEMVSPAAPEGEMKPQVSIPLPEFQRIDSPNPREPEIDETARTAIREINTPPPTKTKRQYTRANIGLRGELVARLGALSKEQLKKVASDSGLSLTTVRDVLNQRTETTQKVAIAISSVLPDLEVTAKQSQDSELRWLRYVVNRAEDGLGYPTAEEAFMAALEENEEEE